MLAWAAGAVVFLLPVIVGRIAVWRLRRRCEPIVAGPAFDLLARVKAHLGLTRPGWRFDLERGATPARHSNCKFQIANFKLQIEYRLVPPPFNWQFDICNLKFEILSFRPLFRRSPW